MRNRLGTLFTSHGSGKFLLLLLIIAAYATFVSVKFGIQDGLSVTLLTWAFFVTCTPIADAGFLVDFPVRIAIGLKMLWSEVVVWVLAAIIIVSNLVLNPVIFENTLALNVLYTVVTNPWPLWLIVVVSAAGTFLSIHIGDQIFSMVAARYHKTHIARLQVKRFVIEATVFVVVIALYAWLLHATGIAISFD